MPDTKPTVDIYTDGACSGNPGPGGWGALLVFKDTRKEIFGYCTETTNNKMEMQAAISALQSLKKACKINLYTDSKYLKQGITEWIFNWVKNNWRGSNKKPVKNADLWQELQKETKTHDVDWYWVKGHSGHYGNDAADRLAVKGKEIAKKELENVICK